MVALSFFAMVIFIGVLPKESKLDMRLRLFRVWKDKQTAAHEAAWRLGLAIDGALA